MRLIAVTQRVDRLDRSDGLEERRDALDQAWTPFLAAAGCRPVLMPNHAVTALALLEILPIAGLLLTGGEDLASMGGEAPDRDAAEAALLARARAWGLPVIGVCRGMQILQQAFGVHLSPVSGHVIARQTIRVDDQPRVVNAYHRWGARESSAELLVWAKAEDGVVKAVRHRTEPLVGIMWHPERQTPFDARDVDLFKRTFAFHRWDAVA